MASAAASTTRLRPRQFGVQPIQKGAPVGQVCDAVDPIGTGHPHTERRSDRTQKRHRQRQPHAKGQENKQRELDHHGGCGAEQAILFAVGLPAEA